MDVHSPSDLDAAALLRVAHGERVGLADHLLTGLDATRTAMLDALASGPPVYGVSTGLGALSELRLDPEGQAGHQHAILVARAVGGEPWLTAREVRAVLGVRLRTFLNGDAAVSADLCRHLVALLDAEVVPAVPRLGSGAAGEIIPLAHLGGALTGDGRVLTAAGTTAAGPVLRDAGIAPYHLGPKEGIALVEGVPVATALALLLADDARRVLRDATVVAAAELALTGASRDVLDPALARGDELLAGVMAELRALAGPEPSPRALQPPVSFRVTPQVLTQLVRALAQLDDAVTRALDGVTDSPSWIDDRFVGTAGFAGYDLASSLQVVTVALAGVAEVGAARLHRLMDPRVTGLNAQLSLEPGRHTGLTPVHKRAVGVVHALRRWTTPATVGTIETSAGQEDVQSFALEAADACRHAVDALADVVACELLAVHQMRVLGGRPLGPALAARVDELTAGLPESAADRPWGLDLAALRRPTPP